MIIKSITLENFLPFKDKHTVYFSTDRDKNVTLVMGNNGAGKTKLAQAFEWCLYGTPPDGIVNVLNAYVRDHLLTAGGPTIYVTVTLEIEKDGVGYTIMRRQPYSRNRHGKVEKPGKHEFAISYKENGQTKPVDVNKLRPTINKILSGELSHYFFFDGEHVKTMKNEIEAGKSSDFAEAVKDILGLQHIATAIFHLKAPGNRSSVERTFRSMYDFAGDQDSAQSNQRISFLERKNESLQDDLEDARADEEAADGRVKEYERLLRENAESEDAAKRVQDAKRLVKVAQDQYQAKLNAVFAAFQKGQYRYFSDTLIASAREELADQDKISKAVPSVNDKTIKFILQQHECICGTTFADGSDIAQHLYKLLEYVPPKDLGTYISEFDKECRVRTEAPATMRSDVAAAYREFGNAAEAVTNAEASLEAAQKYLNSLNGIDVKMLRSNLKDAEIDRSRAASRAGQIVRDMSKNSTEIKECKDRIDAHSAASAKNRQVARCLEYVSYIYNSLSAYYDAKEKETRTQLEEAVNRFFSAMYDGELHLVLDENYGVTVKVEDIETTDDAWQTSGGQTMAIILSFILGILDIAKSNIEQGDEMLRGDTYPLVMDAPLSDFDKTRIGTICNLLPIVAEQVIIIIKDTDGDLAEQYLSDRIGKRYTVQNLRDYESVISESAIG